jgi:hypothetical protein
MGEEVIGHPAASWGIDNRPCGGPIISGNMALTDGMRRPVSGRDAIRSQVIDVLEAQKIKETGNEEG